MSSSLMQTIISGEKTSIQSSRLGIKQLVRKTLLSGTISVDASGVMVLSGEYGSYKADASDKGITGVS